MSVLVRGILFAFVVLVLISLADAQSERRRGQRRSMADRLRSLDKNQDGELSADELPEKQRKRLLSRADANEDGIIDAIELRKFARGGNADRRPEEPEQEDIGKETATHEEIEALPIQFGELKALRLCDDGNLMAGDTKAGVIKIISPAGELVNTIAPGLPPEVFDVAADSSIYCGGDGRVAKLAPDGSVLKTVELPDETEDDAVPSRGGRRPPGLSGLAVADDAIYVTFGSGWSVSSKAQLFRFDLDLEDPILVADGFRGCCQHCDLVFRDGVLYLAENAAFRIVSFDR